MTVTKAIGEISVPKQWKNLPISKLSDEGYPVYGANGIIGFYKEFNHDKPTIAITCRGASCGNIHLTLPQSYIASNAMALDNLDTSICNIDYLVNFLKFRGLSDVISGAAQPQITRTNLEKVKIPLPPLEDQTRIATLLSKVESLIARRKKSIADLDELLKSTFLEMFGDPVRNEMGWVVKKLGEISKVQGGLQVTSKRKSNPIEMPYLRVANVYRDLLVLDEIKIIRVTESEINRVSLKKGDVLIVEGHGNPNEIGRSAVWDGSIEKCLHQNHLIRVRLFDEVLPIYCSFYINSSAGRQQMFRAGKTTSGLNTISSKNVKDTLILIPPLTDQNQFTVIVEKVESLKKKYQKSLNDLETLYSALSQKAFKGELDLGRIPLTVDLKPKDKTAGKPQVGEPALIVQDKPDKARESREEILHQLFKTFLSGAKNIPISLDDFWPKVEEKFMDLLDEDAQPLGIPDYDRVRDWLFDMLAAGSVIQVFNEQENRMEIRAVS